MLAFAVAFGVIAVLAVVYRRDRDRLMRQRWRFFDSCLDVFQSYRVVQDGLLFPALKGTYRGCDVRLEGVIDDMAWRKLPVLWLRVTVLKPNCYGGVLDLLVRPGGVEVYSPSADLHYHLPIPSGWPDQALLCSDNPDAIPPLDLLTPHMAIFTDPYMKELVTTARGVRLVRMISQANRLRYLLFREARFDGGQLDPAVARAMLDRAVAIADALSEAGAVGKAA